MLGLMQRQPLLISSLLAFAARHHGDAEIVSDTVEGPRHRYTYREVEVRARRLARALDALGVRPGDRVGTLARNGYRHLELYFAVPGMGAVLHTVNPRLFEEQVAYIIDDAEDRVLFADLTFVPLVERVLGRHHLPDALVVMSDRAHLPEVRLPSGMALHAYEDLLAAAADDFDWPELDEEQASGLCDTSGTTGHPKGVLYSHRSTVLQTYASALPDVFCLRAVDRVLPVVAMFHVNAWRIPYAAAMVGAGLVLAGAKADGASLHGLIASERVTFAAAVPTVWLGLVQHLRASGGRLDGLQRACVGGAACPQALLTALRDELGLEVAQGWGMTETSAAGAYNRPGPADAASAGPASNGLGLKQGRALFGTDRRIVDAEGRDLPWDGFTAGELLVRGPRVCRRHYRAERDAVDAEGWFRTGDVATIDPAGHLEITDRAKDLSRPGGEWIRSLELENVAMSHPDVAEAAVIAAKHPRWGERPLLLVVPKPERQPDPEGLRAWYRGRVASMSVPDAALLVCELPHTATGKLLKTALRDQYGDYYLRPSQGS